MSADNTANKDEMTKEEWNQLTECEQQAWLDAHCDVQSKEEWRRHAIAEMTRGVSPLDDDMDPRIVKEYHLKVLRQSLPPAKRDALGFEIIDE